MTRPKEKTGAELMATLTVGLLAIVTVALVVAALAKGVLT